MTTPRHIAVIDVGKTNVKLALVDRPHLTEIAVLTRPNTVHPGPPWPQFDLDGHWAFLTDALARFHRDHGVDAISVTTHGASAVLLNADGGRAAPMLDYEHTGPDTLAANYDALRPAFAQTGSPRLPVGLNLGAQLYWQFQTDPGLRDRVAHILTYPQYWGYLLTGQLACDVTSLGCHTDLWEPRAGQFSALVDRLGLRDRFAPVRQPGDVLGRILPAVAAATGLPQGTPVAVGIHDSNASLYPHLLTRDGPFAVVSTGTWVVVMAMGGRAGTLDPARDTLMNVDALGAPVPSARFMGGREYEGVRQGHDTRPTGADIAAVLDAGLMLLPAVEPGSGPYQGQTARWTGPEPAPGSGQRMAALSFYLALMTDTCLGLTGAEGPVIVEGPFARNAEYRGMLAAATGRAVVDSGQSTGTSIGAALLFGGPVAPAPAAKATDSPPEWRSYANKWRVLAVR